MRPDRKNPRARKSAAGSAPDRLAELARLSILVNQLPERRLRDLCAIAEVMAGTVVANDVK